MNQLVRTSTQIDPTTLAGRLITHDGVLGTGHLFVADGQRLHQFHGVDAHW